VASHDDHLDYFDLVGDTAVVAAAAAAAYRDCCTVVVNYNWDRPGDHTMVLVCSTWLLS